MIWFDCKKCGKRHGKADNLAGTLVFCECGEGNRVPWSSTAPEPAAPPPRAPSRPLPSRPSRPPGDEDDDDGPGARWRDRRPGGWERRTDDRDDLDRPEPSLPRRQREGLRRVRAGFCFNHTDQASEKTCEECQLPFCSNCVAQLEGKTLCGPCKNFRIAVLGRPARTPTLAILALVVALASGPVVFILTFFAIGLAVSQEVTGGAVGLCLLALIMPVAGLVMGLMALKQVETTPQAGGRSLATSGAATSAIGAVWCLAVAILLLAKQFGG